MAHKRGRAEAARAAVQGGGVATRGRYLPSRDATHSEEMRRSARSDLALGGLMGMQQPAGFGGGPRGARRPRRESRGDGLSDATSGAAQFPLCGDLGGAA